MSLDDLLGELRARGASDLLLRAGEQPRLRAFRFEEQLRIPGPTPDDVVGEILDRQDRRRLDEKGLVRTSHVSTRHGRFRADVLRAADGSIEITFHAVPSSLPTPDALGLDAKLLIRLMFWPTGGLRPGLLFVGGPSGSGRSMVQALLVDRLLAEIAGHVLTIEDPVEYVHSSARALVTQRELGRDVPSVEAAAESALRDLPDVICIGPIERDTVVEAALRLAEAGALVIGTTEATTCTETRNRLLAPFPAARRPDIQRRLGRHLSGIHCQVPVPLTGSRAFVPAVETLYGSTVSRRLFAHESDEGLHSGMQRDYSGVTRNQSLASLLYRRTISVADAYALSPRPDELRGMIARGESLQGHR